jgi:hypothetical protein
MVSLVPTMMVAPASRPGARVAAIERGATLPVVSIGWRGGGE